MSNAEYDRRQKFAIAAFSALISRTPWGELDDRWQSLAKEAVEAADALEEALYGKKGEKIR